MRAPADQSRPASAAIRTVVLACAVLVSSFAAPAAYATADGASEAPAAASQPPGPDAAQRDDAGALEPVLDPALDPAADRAAAEEALAQVQAMLGVDDGQGAPKASTAAAQGAEPDLSLALRDLGVRLDDLSRADRREARRILARPTAFYEGDYTTYEPGADLFSTCGPNICVHWVEDGPHAPSLDDADLDGVPDQAALTLATMEQVRARILAMGYRPPLPDARNVADPDGKGRFDVYLADVGGIEPVPLFGYCAWESKAGYDFAGTGYCVLDNDFSSAQFGGEDPVDSLRVTAAHEFFHAVQFAYDAVEDVWFMESTATWIEDEIYDDLNGNRAYLDESQLFEPNRPLDDPRSVMGNWVFFRWLSERHGPRIVLQAWREADSVDGVEDLWGLAAVRAALRSRGISFGAELARYAADLRFATQVFDEAGEDARWRSAPRGPEIGISGRQPVSGQYRLELRQTGSESLQVPTTRKTSRMRRLAVTVDAPPRRRGVRVLLVQVRADGSRVVRPVRLDRSGAGTAVIGFFGPRVERVLVVAASTSTRMACWEGTRLSCEGKRLDDRLEVGITVAGRR